MLAIFAFLVGGASTWHLYRVGKLRRQVEAAKTQARESEQQRNSVQEELYRRLY